MQTGLEQIQIWSLFIACPIKISHEKCPFNEVRTKTLKERVERLLQLSEQETESLLNYCNNCLYYHELGDLDAIDHLESSITKIDDIYQK